MSGPSLEHSVFSYSNGYAGVLMRYIIENARSQSAVLTGRMRQILHWLEYKELNVLLPTTTCSFITSYCESDAYVVDMSTLKSSNSDLFVLTCA